MKPGCVRSGNAQAVAAEALLLDAVMNKRQKPEAVLTALRTLEDLHKAQAKVSGVPSSTESPKHPIFIPRQDTPMRD